MDDLREQVTAFIDARKLRKRGHTVVFWLSISGLLGLILFAGLAAYALLQPSSLTWPMVLVGVGGVGSMAYWLWQLWHD